MTMSNNQSNLEDKEMTLPEAFTDQGDLSLSDFPLPLDAQVDESWWRSGGRKKNMLWGGVILASLSVVLLASGTGVAVVQSNAVITAAAADCRVRARALQSLNFDTKSTKTPRAKTTKSPVHSYSVLTKSNCKSSKQGSLSLRLTQERRLSLSPKTPKAA